MWYYICSTWFLGIRISTCLQLNLIKLAIPVFRTFILSCHFNTKKHLTPLSQCYFITVLHLKYWKSLRIYSLSNTNVRAIATGSILARPLSAVSQGKNKIPFYKKQITIKIVIVIFGLVRLIILHYNRLKSHMKMCKIISASCTQLIVKLTRYSV